MSKLLASALKKQWEIEIDLGTGAEWLAAIGGIATALIALFVLWREQNDRRAERDVRERGQAEQVLVSYPRRQSSGTDGLSKWDEATSQMIDIAVVDTVDIHNASKDVINEVTVTFHNLSGKGKPLPAADPPSFRERMLPGERWQLERLQRVPQTRVPATVNWVPIVAFDDANDVRWNIDGRHHLARGAPQMPTGAEDDPVAGPITR